MLKANILKANKQKRQIAYKWPIYLEMTFQEQQGKPEEME